MVRECQDRRPKTRDWAPTEPAFESRTRLLELSVGVVEDLRCAGVSSQAGPQAFSPDCQVALPYRGLFIWHVGAEEIVGDPNQVVYVTGGEEYRVSRPFPDGYGEVIITPNHEVLCEIAGANDRPLGQHPLFRERSWPADPRIQSFRTRFLQWATRTAPTSDALQAEELVLSLLRRALSRGGSRERMTAPSTKRLIRRTKEFLESNLSASIRLTEIARAVGASPAYLTDVFSRTEGLPLHRYLTQLRLARALIELPHAEDLSALALDLGFSSHSHFTFAFRRVFGCTPSQFRKTARRATPPSFV